MMTPKLSVYCLVAALLLWSCFSWASGTTVSYDAHSLIINGQRCVIFSGSIHYARSSPEMWPDLIGKAKAGGLDAIESFVFWNLHEPKKREYDFTGRADVVNFFKLVQQSGLYGILRIGPYVSADWNYGGLPVWLHNVPGIHLRTNSQIFKEEVQPFITKIVNMFKAAGLFAPQGGPIILAQIENDYGSVMGSYGVMGDAYLQWCAQLAQSLDVGIPWIMSQQPSAPKPIIDTCNGYYCDTFTPSNPGSPRIWTENWVGGCTKWGDAKPRRAAEDVAFAVARFFQAGGVVQNYYMYHGGTNFGRSAGGPFVTTSYDYDAPINEYGMLNQPKWGHLKNLHAAIKLGENLLTSGTSTSKQLPGGVTLTTYTNKTGGRFCFLSNPSAQDFAFVDLQQDGKYNLPPWSVSILQGCNFEVFNTAKVNAQTSMIDYNPASVNNAYAVLSWSWTPEPRTGTTKGKATVFTASKLLDQKEATVDASDYLWYTIRVGINDSSWSMATLRVNTSGHVLHGYVNNQEIGVQWGKSGEGFTFQGPANLRLGTNIISFLSATVGLANSGAFFDLVHTGIAGGPVQLINGGSTMDLSLNVWSYKVGLNGENAQLYNPYSPYKVLWMTDQIPILRPMTWYKAHFHAPAGNDPVVVNLQGMQKGEAWVNGISIGRYWVSSIASSSRCSSTCDYRGKYTPDKCLTNCGEPTQTKYHVPRSLLRAGLNALVLLEEMGGDPTKVNFQTAVVSTVCNKVPQGGTLDLSCPSGHSVSQIKYASYGNPQGSCRDFGGATCEAAGSMSVVQEACVGKQWCSLQVSDATFGPSTCKTTTPWLAVEATCS